MRKQRHQDNAMHDNAYIWGVACFCLLVLSAGCAPLLQEPAAMAVPPGSVLFMDNFSEPPSGWGIWNREGALVEYQNGGLRFLINEPHYDFWSVAGKDFTNVQIEVDAVKWAGPDDNDFGLICRYVDKDNFYMLIVSSDGYYGIAKMAQGQYSMIGAEQLQYSDAIIRGQAVNHLRADCVGSTLRLYANDHLLMDASDGDFSTGDVGLVAGAYGESGVEIYFDNFLVKQAE